MSLDDSPWKDRMLSILRIVAGLMFMTAGTVKLFGFPGTPFGPMDPVPLMTQMGIGGILETFGGLLIALGLFTRPVAFIVSGEMAVAYFQFHFPKSIYPTENDGVGAALYCFIFLYLVFAGAGPWSIDAAIRRSRGG